MRNYVQKPKNQYDNKEIQHGLQLINNVTSIQVEFGLSIAQIYVDEHFKNLKRFPFQSFNELVLMLFDHCVYFLTCF